MDQPLIPADQYAHTFPRDLQLLREAGVATTVSAPRFGSLRFMYGDGENEQPLCQLKCWQCIAAVNNPRTGGTRRCRRRVCTSVPFCVQHLKSVMHVRVVNTEFGKGLEAFDPAVQRMFTRANSNRDPTTQEEAELFRQQHPVFVPREPGVNTYGPMNMIGTYFGDVLSREELDQRYPGQQIAPYGVNLTFTGTDGDVHSVSLDAACLRSFVSLINHHSTDNNCVLGADSDSTVPFIFISVTRPILHGEPILLDYGADYAEALYKMNNEEATESVPHPDTMTVRQGRGRNRRYVARRFRPDRVALENNDAQDTTSATNVDVTDVEAMVPFRDQRRKFRPLGQPDTNKSDPRLAYLFPNGPNILEAMDP